MLDNICFVIPVLQYLYLNIITYLQRNKKVNN